MRYYIISGEKSGDLYGSYIMESIKNHDSNATFICWGGDKMELKGGKMIRKLNKLSFMGFWEVFKNLFTVLYNIQLVKISLNKTKPDVLILIDYPGFNLKVAEYAKRKNIKVFWFIAPQIWAWNESRIKKIKKYVDRMYAVLPFEKEYFKSKSYNVKYFGHPLSQIIDKRKYITQNKKKIISLFPGSRKQEIKKMLPEMLKLVKHFRDYKFIIGGVGNIDINFYKKIIKNKKVNLVIDQTYELMSYSSACVVASGTVSLEAAFFNLPQIVCYKTSFISYEIAKKFVKTKYISLVNIILNKLVVDELIQTDFNSENLIICLEKSLNKKSINTLKKNYENLMEQLNSKFSFNLIVKDILSFYNDN